MKNGSDELISRLNMAEDRVSRSEDISTETPKTKKLITKRLKKKTQTNQDRRSKNCGTTNTVTSA